ncbi:sodium-coupled monocarboxylate transporter 1-like [Diadema antillarum]|uniref:sodium-coupled monocarboxylate transporter 1-like n=1 Tax=Diadema antillarum TaxID=105358 RepID=UPI003A8A31E0
MDAATFATTTGEPAPPGYNGQPSGPATFSAVDYVVFVLVLLVSASIGIYYACTGGKQKTTQEFFVADRKMPSVPVGFSLLASWMSAIALLGTPSEVYVYGTMFWYIGGSYILMSLLVANIYIPTFYKLRLTSVYEYLELRFSVVARLIGTAGFVIYMVMYMSIVLYAPALAVNAVTGFTLWGSVLTVGLVCTFYTSLGGMKAVIWTDVFQTIIMVSCLIAVIIHGSIKMDGFANVWSINKEGGRVIFDDIRVNPTIRHTVWSLIFGATFNWLATFGCNQASVQRYLSCPTLRAAKWSIYLNCPMLFIFVSLCLMCGLVMFAVFADCDPIKAGFVANGDQLLPFYVVTELGFIHGLPGLFIAAIFSGTLSTVSSGLNSLAAVTVEDIIKPLKRDISERSKTITSKILAAVYGLVAIGMAFVASRLGPLLTVAIGLMGMIGGPLLGMFTLGILFPWANNIGVIVGSLFGFGVSFWIGVGAYVYPPVAEKLPTSIDGCLLPNVTTTVAAYLAENVTSVSEILPDSSDPYPRIAKFYSISYLWYSFTALMVVLFVGLLTSFLTGATRPRDLNPDLLCPLARKLFCCCPVGCRRVMECGVEYDQEAKEKRDANDWNNHDIEGRDYTSLAENGTGKKGPSSNSEITAF